VRDPSSIDGLGNYPVTASQFSFFRFAVQAPLKHKPPLEAEFPQFQAAALLRQIYKSLIRMPLAIMMRTSALHIRRLLHSLALRRTILPLRHHTTTNRVRTLLRFAHGITSAPLVSAFPNRSHTVTYADNLPRSLPLLGVRRPQTPLCLSPCRNPNPLADRKHKNQLQPGVLKSPHPNPLPLMYSDTNPMHPTNQPL
jgi:hypothetical protein